MAYFRSTPIRVAASVLALGACVDATDAAVGAPKGTGGSSGTGALPVGAGGAVAGVAGGGAGPAGGNPAAGGGACVGVSGKGGNGGCLSGASAGGGTAGTKTGGNGGAGGGTTAGGGATAGGNAGNSGGGAGSAGSAGKPVTTGGGGGGAGAGGDPPYEGPTFTDVAAEAGLTYVQMEATCTNTCKFAYMTGGAAVADYDGDGKPDIAVSRLCGPIILYRNKGDGTFEDVSAAAGFSLDVPTNGLAFADIDGDGDLDLYATGFLADRFYLWVNQGNGTFVEDAVARGVSVPAVTPGDPHYGAGISFGDYDHDGYLDAFVAEWRSSKFLTLTNTDYARLLHNRGVDGPGYFEDRTIAAGLDLTLTTELAVTAMTPTFIDLDDDGWVDLPMANDYHTSVLFWNNGNGTFLNGTKAAGVGKDEYGMGAAFGDFDADGHVDWFVTSISSKLSTGNHLYKNVGGRTFQDVSKAAGIREGGWGWGTAFFDYDNDGDLDLGMVAGVTSDNGDMSWKDSPPHLWRNEGGTTFSDVTAPVGIASARTGRAYSVLDFDGDGDLDVLVVTFAGKPHLWRNDGGNAKDWLRVVARGKHDKQGVGAKVFVTPSTGAPTQRRDIVVGGSYVSQHESVAHFGLGSGGGLVAEVRVRFPGAAEDVVVKDVPRRSTITVTEMP